MVQNNLLYDELAENFIQKHFGEPVIRIPFHMNYIGKTKLGEILHSELREEDIRFLAVKDFSAYSNSFRNELIKVGILGGNQFILFRSDNQTLYLDIVPKDRRI